ncbi:MAG: peptidase U34 [Candidatus Lokiarchaeota archaeon]|nr:peptidase U34 [Candidatus Lokiarchaeota archaeon]
MCDTIVVLGNSTEDGATIFAKNSDRYPNESQGLLYFPRKKHDSSEIVKCNYIKIPQVKETYEVLLSVPYWIWGAEMGCNEFGVAIGNEAVFSKMEYKERGLLGMDLLRLALERSKTSEDALETIIFLLEKYGQGGSANINDPNYIYHNSFIIADPNEAWVLETADKLWVAKKVSDIMSISNGYTLEDWDRSAPNIVQFAIEKNLCKSEDDFNWVDCYSDPVPRTATNCVARQKQTMDYLSENKGNINISMIMNLLRTHNSKDVKDFNPAKGGMTICMHYSSRALSQTTNSMVSYLPKGKKHTHWLTTTSAPCISLFKPFYLGVGIPQIYHFPNEKYDSKSLWWKHEKLHRLAIMDYKNRAPVIQEAYSIEKKFIDKSKIIVDRSHESKKSQKSNKLNLELENLSIECLKKQNKILKKLIRQFIDKAPKSRTSRIYLKKWKKLSDAVDLSFD